MATKITIIVATTVLTLGFVKHTFWGTPASSEEPIPITTTAIDEEELVVEPIMLPDIAATNNLLPKDKTIYHWDEAEYDWVPVDKKDLKATTTDAPSSVLVEPIDITWPFLMDINYKLKYYEEVEMEMYAPIFPDAIKELASKEVMIEGFVIPFDEEGDLLALSANPFASCFFCGKASPASVISLHLRKKKNRYKMDDYLKFRGTLLLNYDDPKEFYYILEEAVED